MNDTEKNFPSVILASQSLVRRQQLIDAKIPFEVIVSDVDETPDESKSFKNQLAEVAMRKAMKVFEETKERGIRVIIAADQNMMFENKMYGKPENLDEARELIYKMRGTDKLYGITGNAVLLADKDRILQSINITDVIRLKFDDISDEEVEEYIKTEKCLTYCGGVSVSDANFIHLIEGRESTSRGMTLEYAKEMIKNVSI